MPHCLKKITSWPLLACTLLHCKPLHADRIRDIVEIDWSSQLSRLIKLEDFTLQIALLGSLFLGISCATLGSFLVVRQRSLFGDTLSHAVLPGVAIGFLWNLNKDPIALFWGATGTAILGAWTVNILKKTTRLKEDTILGLVLGGFYGLGICLLSMIQKIPEGTQAGLDAYLFGQASALSELDIMLLLIIFIVNHAFLFLFHKQLLLLSFDPQFARASGLHFRIFDLLITTLVALTIVVSLKAVGAILVSALLIIPGATALLLASRMHHVLILSGLFGFLSSILGAGLSFLGHNLPTGPFIVLVGSFGFAMTFLLAPKKGVLWRLLERRAHSVH